MRAAKIKDRSKLIRAAMGEIPCDLTVRNIRFFNVFTGEIYPAEVDVLDGFVVRVREDGQQAPLVSKSVYDGSGNYLVPGYIDCHMHVESTLLIPENVSRAIVPWGTTTVCTDPHEIGNVMGVPGIRFMLDNGRKSALRHYVLAPSCVPAVPGLENAGAVFLKKEISELLEMDDVIGVAEIMDFIGVIHDNERMHSIVDAGIAHDAYLQGHAPKVSGKELAAYRLGGPVSDHESVSAEEVREKLRNGMHVNLRVSSLVSNIEDLVEGCADHPWQDFVSFCTDDVHAKDLLTVGHINYVLRRVVECGIDERIATKMATLNAAREYGFEDLGAIAPGYIADMLVVPDLRGSRPAAVFIEGRLVAENGKYLGGDRMEEKFETDNTVSIPQIESADDLYLKVPEGYTGETICVNVAVPIPGGKGMRECVPEELPVKNGKVDLSGDPSLAYVACINRHGLRNKTVAVYRGLPLMRGALASTVSHDSHNMTICYRSPEDAFISCRTLASCGGGISCTDGGKETHLTLEIAGLMSRKACREVSDDIDRVQAAVDGIAPQGMSLMTPTIMSLPVMPGVVVTDVGIVDGRTQELIGCFPDL